MEYEPQRQKAGNTEQYFTLALSETASIVVTKFGATG
jgi:hypothetical protein